MNTPTKSRSRLILRRIRQAAIGLVALIASLIVFGLIYESAMALGDADRFPPPGQLVEVNGHQMHLHCVGEGSPTVVFESGFADTSLAWTLVQPEVGKFTRACAYDRAGMGWSEASAEAEARTPSQIATELHSLLEQANVPGPYVLVGHSLGGKYIRLFAAQYPESVAGLVFVDARHEINEPTGRSEEQDKADGEAYEASLNMYRLLRQLGVVRAFAVPLVHSMDPSSLKLPDEVVYQRALMSVRESYLQTMILESRNSTADDALLRETKLPQTLPVVVLTAKSSFIGYKWAEGQEALAALTSNSQWIVVENSSHFIQFDQPAAVIETIRGLIDNQS